MANKRIKRVIIAGAGFSAPAKLPIQSRIIDRMAEVPEMDFLIRYNKLRKLKKA